MDGFVTVVTEFSTNITLAFYYRFSGAHSTSKREHEVHRLYFYYIFISTKHISLRTKSNLSPELIFLTFYETSLLFLEVLTWLSFYPSWQVLYTVHSPPIVAAFRPCFAPESTPLKTSVSRGYSEHIVYLCFPQPVQNLSLPSLLTAPPLKCWLAVLSLTSAGLKTRSACPPIYTHTSSQIF